MPTWTLAIRLRVVSGRIHIESSEIEMGEKSITIRAEAPRDERSIQAVNCEAFGREGEAALVDAIRLSPGFIPALSLIAEEDGVAVGHIMLSAINIHGDGRDNPALALAPLAVLPAWQRRGVGGMLVAEAIARTRALGYSIVVVLGHPDYYPRFGFEPATNYRIRCPFPAPAEAFMVLALRPGALDGVRGLVVYPTAFEAL